MDVNTLILGAGAAGMMCAAHAGPSVLVIDHARAPGEKIRISGGGRCNFTNLNTDPARFLGANPHFHKSALSRYTQWDFIDLVDRHRIAWHEKTLGQLFCDDKATQIIDMLRAEMAQAGAELWLQTSLTDLGHDGTRFTAQLERDGKRTTVTARNLVLATGGRSIPKMGATGLAYEIAQDFGLRCVETRPGLVPMTFAEQDLALCRPLAGVSLEARIRHRGGDFRDALLFTHRGLSGPVILQISSFWQPGEVLEIDLLPGIAIGKELKRRRAQAGRIRIAAALGEWLPQRLADAIATEAGLAERRLADQPNSMLEALEDRINRWRLRPVGTEGYRTAEVTLGGVDTRDLDARTLQARKVPGLHFIGECVDVTGWLGGYNFQWAWASGHAAGIAARDG